MAIRDIYRLQRSEQFILGPRQEITVNLSLEKTQEEPCTFLLGCVTGSCKPVKGATVKAFDRDYKPIAHTVTDPEGRFVFLKLLPPGEYKVIATAEGYKVSRAYELTLEPGKPVIMHICLEVSDIFKLGTLYGVVYNEVNLGLPNAKVLLSDYHRPDAYEAFTQTNTDGEFLVYGLKPKRYWLSASKEGYFLPQRIAVELYPNEMTCADLFLYPDGSPTDGTVSGIIDFQGQSVTNAVAALYRAEDRGHTLLATKETNESGFYLFPNVKPGAYIVKAKTETDKKPEVIP
jgi:hypothetical protein